MKIIVGSGAMGYHRGFQLGDKLQRKAKIESEFIYLSVSRMCSSSSATKISDCTG